MMNQIRSNSVSRVGNLISWLFVAVTPAIIFFVFSRNWTTISIVNNDYRHGWLAWSQASPGYWPWQDPILYDPGASIPRLAMLVPNSFLFLLRQYLSPQFTWLISVALGGVLLFFIIRKLLKLDHVTDLVATLGSVIFVSLFSVLADFPPLSKNQLDYIFKIITFSVDYKDLFPLFSGSFFSYFSVPYFFGLILLTVKVLVPANKNGVKVVLIKTLWVVLCSLMPLVYFYHFVQFVFLLPVILYGGMITKHVTYKMIVGFVTKLLPYPLFSWCAYYLIQNWLIRSPGGYDYMLTVGLQEHRQVILVVGTIVRSIIFFSIFYFLLRDIFEKHLVPWLSFGILIQSSVLQNIQLIIGKTIQPSHFGFLNPYAVALLWVSVLIYFWKKHFRQTGLAPTFRLSLLVAILLFTFVFHSMLNMKLWNSIAQESRIDTPRVELFEFIESTPELKVYLTNDVELTSQILFLYSKYSYLPWGALSTINPDERIQRSVYAWKLLEPQTDFGEWLNSHSWELFHMKYGVTSSYSSTLWHDPFTRNQVMLFRQHNVLPLEENKYYFKYKNISTSKFRLDAIIYPKNSFIPDCIRYQHKLFENNAFYVFTPPTSCVNG